jgi:outer membrane protein insertion porin family
MTTCLSDRKTCWRYALGILLSFFVWWPAAHAQDLATSLKIVQIVITNVGPSTVNLDLVRGNIRTKVGDAYLPATITDDVHNLYATGLFYNVRVGDQLTDNGIILTFVLQENPRLTDIKFEGNKKYTDAKILKKVTSKVGEPLDERKLFTDSQEIQKMYQKAGYPGTVVKAVPSIIESSGRATATFQINEGIKIKIVEVDFVGAQAFTQKKLRKTIKTRRHWMFSWLTGSGVYKDEQFEDDQDALREYYREHGYIDFDIKDIRKEYPTPETMIIRFVVYEGKLYKVGSVKFIGNKLFTDQDLAAGMVALHEGQHLKNKLGPHGLGMDVGDHFTPKGMADDVQQVEDAYGTKGYIDVTQGSGNLRVERIPNTDTGTMDLEFNIKEGQKSYIEKIEIRGNTKTKDRVIRRELAVAPGEVFDQVRVKITKARLENLQYFEKVDTRPEATSVPSRKDLIIGVDEKNTGNVSVGAGFSSVDALVGFAELSQGNFDLFNPPTFTGGGQKLRLQLQLGTKREDADLTFIEPWFLGRKLSLTVDLYHHELDFQSPNNLYDESHTGVRFSLSRALGSDFLIGSVNYTIDNVGVTLNQAYGGQAGQTEPGQPFPTHGPVIPPTILKDTGYSLLTKVGGSLAYETRNSTQLPDKGQHTELSVEAAVPAGGVKEYYRIELKSDWYFKGFRPGHVIEAIGHTGVADAFGSTADVPFYDRWYLGGLYSLRGFKYHNIAPRDPDTANFHSDEPVGGDTYWYASVEYSIPIIDRLRFAMFYDMGQVSLQPYKYTFKDFDANVGLGIRLNLPIGPLRLDYGIPVVHDQFNSGKGQFQFGVGYTREF